MNDLAIACRLCEIYTNSEVIMWENEYFFSICDDHPITPGHSIIIPKRHFANFSEIDENEWVNLKYAIPEVIRTIESINWKDIYTKKLEKPVSETSGWFLQKALDGEFIKRKPDGYNQGINDGKAAGRTIDHLHWHIIPRYFGDVEDPRGGIRYIIPEMGNYKIPRI